MVEHYETRNGDSLLISSYSSASRVRLLLFSNTRPFLFYLIYDLHHGQLRILVHGTQLINPLIDWTFHRQEEEYEDYSLFNSVQDEEFAGSRLLIKFATADWG